MTEVEVYLSPVLKRDRLVGSASLFVVAVSFAFGPTVSSRVTVHPLVSTFVRMCMAGALHWLVALGIRRPPSGALLRISVLPGLLFCLNNILFFAALQRASVANATLMISLQPIVVLILARPLFGEPVRASDYAWTGVALCGTAFAILAAASGTRTKPTTAAGVALAIASMFAYTGYFLLAKRANSVTSGSAPHPISYMTAVTTMSAIVSLPFVVLSGRFDEVGRVTGSQFSAVGIVVMVAAIAHVFMAYTHRHIEASVSSLILLSQPITSAFVAWWILGQRIVIAQLIGGVTVVGSVAMLSIGRWKLSRSPGLTGEHSVALL